jgi:glycosyltransferase involved in cell wall biosynthesis
MKILHVNFSDSVGGAAVAVNRIHSSLLKLNLQSSLLVKEKLSYGKNIIGPKKSLDIIFSQIKKIIFRKINLFYKTNNLSTHSLSIFPTNFHKIINNIDADIVHLHWVNNEMISIKEISKIKKPIVWTFHDMWPFCGAEHYSYNKRYIKGYQVFNRPIFEKGCDINRWIWSKKKKYWNFKFHIVCPSKWMFNAAKKSDLFKNQEIQLIPHPISSRIWRPINKNQAKKIIGVDKDKITLLYSSTVYGNDTRKGSDIINKIFSTETFNKNKFQFIILGSITNLEKIIEKFNCKIFKPTFNDYLTLRLLYSASDLLLSPSKLEAFGQVIIEAGACGTPAVAFNNTGSVDLIHHKITGYLAKNNNIDDFEKGVRFCLSTFKKNKRMGWASKVFVNNEFSEKKIAKMYLKLYEKILRK